MMLFALLKKDFLIVKKYVLIMLVVIALIHLSCVGGHRSLREFLDLFFLSFLAFSCCCNMYP